MTDLPLGVSAIVVSWHTGPRLYECLNALAMSEDIDEIIVVDNGNPKGERARLDALAQEDARLSVHRGQGNVGFARGCNLGATRAAGQRLLFINPDAVLQPESIAAMIAAERGRRRPLIVGGRVVGLDGREQRGGRRDTLTPWSAFREFSGLTRLGRWSKSLGSMHHEHEDLPDEPIAVGAVSGAFMMIRADDFRDLGGFDGDYFVHVEDLDICRRAWDQGGAVVFAPQAWVRHEGATSPASAVRVAWYKGKGFANYFRKFATTDAARRTANLSAPFIVGAAVLQGLARSVTAPRKQRAPTPYESFEE